MGGLSVGSSDGRRMRLDGREFIRLITEKTLSMPIIDKLEIQDKSKADWVTKSIACAQIAWFVCRLISRAVQRLPVTTLELFTLTIVCCTVTTYVLWWQKPHDIRKPFVIKGTYTPHTYGARVGLVDGASLGNDRSRSLIFVILVSVVFGACHALGWNFSFVTPVEGLLWRISTILVGFGPLSIVFYTKFAYNLVEEWLKGLSKSRGETLADMPMYLLVSVLVIVRVYLFVEIFAGLRSVPAGVYKSVDWIRYFPHV